MKSLVPLFARIDEDVKRELQVFVIYDRRYTMSGVVEESIKDFLSRNQPTNAPKLIHFRSAA